MLSYFVKPILKKLRNGIRNQRLMKTTNSKIEFTAECDHSTFEGYNYVGNNSKVYASKVGYGTYISENAAITATEIGRYTSIGPGLKIAVGRHPLHMVSMYPAFYSNNHITQVNIPHQESNFEEVRLVANKIVCRIGNDVWVGANVCILDGIIIGDGAVIAAGAVVTKDVEPYAIVGGVPAKVIKKRFSDDIIGKLQNLKWWDKDIAWINLHGTYFESPDKLETVLNEEFGKEEK